MILEGLYNIRAVAANADEPDVTVFRSKARQAIQYVADMSAKYTGKYKYYIVNHALDAWDVYDAKGKLKYLCSSVSHESWMDAVRENPGDRTDVLATALQEAKIELGDDAVTQLAYVDWHREASAVDHTNFLILLRRMIQESEDDDLQRLYLVHSKATNNVSLGLYANVSKLTAEIQDLYIDRYRHISKRFPLSQERHKETLAHMLASCRVDYGGEVLRTCARAAHVAEDEILGMMATWALTDAETRYPFALHVVQTLHSGIKLDSNRLEFFSDEIMDEHGAEAIKSYEKFLGAT